MRGKPCCAFMYIESLLRLDRSKEKDTGWLGRRAGVTVKGNHIHNHCNSRID